MALDINNALHFVAVQEMLAPVFDQVFALILPGYCLVHGTTLEMDVNHFAARLATSSAEAYLVAVGTLVINTLVTSLLLDCITVILPKVAINIWIFPCLDNFCNGLHFSSSSWSRWEVIPRRGSSSSSAQQGSVVQLVLVVMMVVVLV